MKTRKIRNALLAVGLIAVFVLTGYAAVYEWPNVGLDANAQTVLYGAKKDEAVYFNCADLEFKLGLGEGELAGITVLSLPNEEDGRLKLGDAAVKTYDRISRTELNDLAFTNPITFFIFRRFCEIRNISGTMPLVVSSRALIQPDNAGRAVF